MTAVTGRPQSGDADLLEVFLPAFQLYGAHTQRKTEQGETEVAYFAVCQQQDRDYVCE